MRRHTTSRMRSAMAGSASRTSQNRSRRRVRQRVSSVHRTVAVAAPPPSSPISPTNSPAFTVPSASPSRSATAAPSSRRWNRWPITPCSVSSSPAGCSVTVAASASRASCSGVQVENTVTRRRVCASTSLTARILPRPGSPALSPSSAGPPPLGQEPTQLAKGLPPVADGVLLLGGQLGHGPEVTARDEDRVVAEPAPAPGFQDQRPLAGGLGVGEPLPRPRHKGHAPIPGCPPGGGDRRDRGDQRPEIVLVGGVLAGEPRGVDAGLAVQRVDLDPRVVGHGGDPDGRRHGPGLQRGVLQVAPARLLDDRPLPGVVLGRDPRHGPLGTDREDLADLPGIARSHRELRREPAGPGRPPAGGAGDRLAVRPGGIDGAHPARESSEYARSRSAVPSTMPALTAATSSRRGFRGSRPCSSRDRTAAASAMYPAVIDAVLVPPSAWSTSQSIQIVHSPMAFRSVTARRDRPMSRWISCVRPDGRPCWTSRGVLVSVARGSMAYSALTQPVPVPDLNFGTRGSYDAAARTRVRPISNSTEPSAHCR